MGKETHNNDPGSGLDPELEAQIVALIHGELSGEEQNRIESEIGRIPAAAIFRQRIEALHELLGEAPQQEEEEWMRAAGGNQNREISGIFFPKGIFRTGKRFAKTGKFPG